jgi:hypothetical protein
MKMMSRYTQTTHFRSSALAAALAITLLLGAGAAQAADVIHDPAGNVIAITNLEFDGEFYDVEFLWGRGIDVIGIPVDFPSNPQGQPALGAVEAVIAVLAAESTPVTSVGPVLNTSVFFDVPYQIIGSNARIVRGNGDGTGGWTAGNVGDSIDYSALAAPDWSWAKFSPPGTVSVEKKSWGRLKSLYR